MMPETTADTGAKRKRESRDERVARALHPFLTNFVYLSAAVQAVIVAYPESKPPPKEKDALPSPDDHCSLFAKRGELQELHDFIVRYGISNPNEYKRVWAIANSLKEQGVVR
jgi:hypothetical protein